MKISTMHLMIITTSPCLFVEMCVLSSKCNTKEEYCLAIEFNRPKAKCNTKEEYCLAIEFNRPKAEHRK